MIYALLKALILKPQLLAEHLRNYGELVREEARDTARLWAIKAAALLVCAIGMLVFLTLTGVAVMLGIVWAAALGYVKAGPQGMKFRNMAVTHEIPWSEIASVRFGPADHWAFVELADTSDRPVLGIMRSDGRLAQEQFDGLAAVAAKHLAR